MPTSLFSDVEEKYKAAAGQWQDYPASTDRMPVRAVYRRAMLNPNHGLVILRNVLNDPVARLVLPHEDLSEADRETMLQSLLSLYLLQNFRSE